MEWVKLSERMPGISEEVELTDGYIVRMGWVWERVEGGSYFECDEADFLPLWWRPQVESALELKFDEHTYVPRIDLDIA